MKQFLKTVELSSLHSKLFWFGPIILVKTLFFCLVLNYSYSVYGVFQNDLFSRAVSQSFDGKDFLIMV